MNPQQSDEWQAIRAEQAALRARLDRLDQRLARFGAAQAVIAPLLTASIEPPPLPVAAPLPGIPRPLPTTPAMPTAAAPERESMEMRIGTEWLVRAGVVLLLTSLAFLGDYLYRNIVPHLGPVSKVGLLYLGAGVLTGLGAWLERSRLGRETPKVRNYARVVLAGGLAAVYYVTYAAHYYPNLRVIGNPVLAGGLLMGWAAFMVWLADRRGSETLATFAILLAFYTSAINEISGFTLAANLPLAAGAVFLMRRHLWKIFPFASLLATFGSYVYWRFFHVANSFLELPGRSPLGGHSSDPGGFWVEAAFLLVYWLMFTWAVFSTPEERLPVERRAGVASVNNGAFFLLVTWSLLGYYPGSFWKWALAFGVVLIALAEGGRRLPKRLAPPVENAFLLEGVLLIAVGFIAYFSDWQLSLALAAQSVALLLAAERRRNRGLLAASALTAGTAVGLALIELSNSPEDFRYLGLGVGAMMAFNAWRCDPRADGRRTGSGTGTGTRTLAVFYEALTLVLAVAWGEQFFRHGSQFVFFGLAGVAVFALGIETQRKRLIYWSYVLTGVGLLNFWLGYRFEEQRHPFQLLGVACLVLQQQFARRRPLVSAKAQTTLIAAAVLTAWVTWSGIVDRWHHGGFTMAVGWSLYAAVLFSAGLALREKAYRWLGLLVLVGTLAHVILLDIWQLDSLERFFSLLCLGIVLLAIGFFYTRYQSRLREFF